MSTSFVTFVSGLQDMTVTGVKRYFDGPPRSIAASDLPAKWVELPQGDDIPITWDGEGGWPTLNAEVWIAIEPVELGTQVENYDATCAIMDNLNTALRAITSGSISKSKLTWTIRGTYSPVGQSRYWNVIARVTGQG